MIYHYFYKITNKIDGCFYYGVHSTKDLNDNYMGSGQKLKYMYKKYGIENFEKQILKFFDTEEEMFDYEREIVTTELIKDKKCYNLTEGGEGYRLGHFVSEEIKNKMSLKSKGRPSKNKGKIIYHLGTENKMINHNDIKIYESLGWQRGIYISDESRKRLSTHGFTGKHFTEEQKKKLSDIKKKQVEDGTFVAHNKGKHLSEEQKRHLSEINTGKKHSEESKIKMSLSRTGKKHSEEWKANQSKGLLGHIVSDETKKKISESNKGKSHKLGPRKKYYWKLQDGTIIYMDPGNAKRLYGKEIIKIE